MRKIDLIKWLDKKEKEALADMDKDNIKMILPVNIGE